MKPLLMGLGAWNADEIETAFRDYFILDEIKIVTRAQKDIGWLQVSETPEEFTIDQLYLVKQMRNKGIGTALITAVISDAKDQGKNVCLSFVKGNPARALYKRLGFECMQSDRTKIHMCLVLDRAN